MKNTFRGYSLLVAAAIIFASCNSSTETHTTNAKSNEPFFKPRSYRRFTGTIAGQPVVVNINCQSGGFAGGTYYYANRSELLDLEIRGDSGSNSKLLVKESLMTATNDDEAPSTRAGNTWTLTWDNGHLSGTFHNGSNGKSSAIALNEDYTDAYRLYFVGYADSTTFQGPSWTAHASCDFNTIVPDKSTDHADADFMEQALVSFKNEDSVEKVALTAYPRKAAARYLASYRKYLNDDSTHEEPMGDFYMNTSTFPVYNSKGLLVVGQSRDEYAGGAHGYSACYFLNIDVKGKKIWHLQNVMQVDSTAITTVLDETARHKFGLGAKDPLDNTLMVEHVPATDNFLISDAGLTFQYPPYEIGSFTAGQIALFVSYKKLKLLLKPGFMTRMDIK